MSQWGTVMRIKQDRDHYSSKTLRVKMCKSSANLTAWSAKHHYFLYYGQKSKKRGFNNILSSKVYEKPNDKKVSEKLQRSLLM